MDRRMMFLVMTIVVVLFVIGLLYARAKIRRFFYPLPANMPAVIGQSTEDLLLAYEQHLAMHSPETLAAFQPGLSAEQIATLEQEYACVLTDDLRALYRWRNGSTSYEIEFVPGHNFVPLEQALKTRDELNDQARSAGFAARSVDAVVSGHRRSWIGVMVDAAGDGYFYDPVRRGRDGSFFFNFLEDGRYVYFPSVKNFLAGVNDCFDEGIYKVGKDGRLREDFARSMNVWKKYGGSNHQ